MASYRPFSSADKRKLDLLQDELFKVLSSAATGQNVATVQPWFPSAGALTVEGGTTYWMDGQLIMTNGTTSHTTALSFTGTATVSAISYTALAQAVVANTTGATLASAWVSQASATVIVPASTVAAKFIHVKGVIRITANAGGTLIPNFTFSADPTGTISVQAGTFLRLRKIGDNAVTVKGTWA